MKLKLILLDAFKRGIVAYFFPVLSLKNTKDRDSIPIKSWLNYVKHLLNVYHAPRTEMEYRKE